MDTEKQHLSSLSSFSTYKSSPHTVPVTGEYKQTAVPVSERRKKYLPPCQGGSGSQAGSVNTSGGEFPHPSFATRL